VVYKGSPSHNTPNRLAHLLNRSHTSTPGPSSRWFQIHVDRCPLSSCPDRPTFPSPPPSASLSFPTQPGILGHVLYCLPIISIHSFVCPEIPRDPTRYEIRDDLRMPMYHAVNNLQGPVRAIARWYTALRSESRLGLICSFSCSQGASPRILTQYFHGILVTIGCM